MHCCSSHKLGTLVFGDPTAETYQHVNWIALTLPDRHYNKLGLEDFRSWGRGRDATYLWKEGKGRDEGKWGVSRSLFLPLSLFLFVSSFWIFILLIYSLFPFFFLFRPAAVFTLPSQLETHGKFIYMFWIFQIVHSIWKRGAGFSVTCYYSSDLYKRKEKENGRRGKYMYIYKIENLEI